jgi:hypothetical protein
LAELDVDSDDDGGGLVPTRSESFFPSPRCVRHMLI